MTKRITGLQMAVLVAFAPNKMMTDEFQYYFKIDKFGYDTNDATIFFFSQPLMILLRLLLCPLLTFANIFNVR